MSEQNTPTPPDVAPEDTPARTPGVKVRALTDITNLEDGLIYRRGDVLEMWRPIEEIRVLQSLCLVEILDPALSPAVVFGDVDDNDTPPQME